MTWPIAVILCVAMACFTAWLWFRAERKKQFETLRAEVLSEKKLHREELEKLHANLKQVADKVVGIGNQAAFRQAK